MENVIEIAGDWSMTKAKLKQKFDRLTDNDFLFLEGKQDDMFKRLQTKLGKTKEEILKIITDM